MSSGELLGQGSLDWWHRFDSRYFVGNIAASPGGEVQMETIVAQPCISPIPREVTEFANRRGFQDALDAVVEMTADVFVIASSLRAEVEADAEVAGLSWIVLRLAIPRADIAQAVALRREWSQRIFDVCPADKVCEFQLHFDWIS